MQHAWLTVRKPVMQHMINISLSRTFFLFCCFYKQFNLNIYKQLLVINNPTLNLKVPLWNKNCITEITLVTSGQSNTGIQCHAWGHGGCSR